MGRHHSFAILLGLGFLNHIDNAVFLTINLLNKACVQLGTNFEKLIG